MSNEMRVLKNFVSEFSPFHNKEVIKNYSYFELFEIVKEIVREHKGE